MSAHVVLNLLNKMKKRDKMQGLLWILSLFRNMFNKLNNTPKITYTKVGINILENDFVIEI